MQRDGELDLPKSILETLAQAVDDRHAYTDDENERSDREVWRANNIHDWIDFLLDRYREHRRTTELLALAARGSVSVAVYLHRLPYESAVSDEGELAAPLRRARLAESFPQIPVLWPSDTTYDPRSLKALLTHEGRRDVSYRLELGGAWETQLDELIDSAKLIVIDAGCDAKRQAAIASRVVARRRDRDAFLASPYEDSASSGPLHRYSDGAFRSAWHTRTAPARVLHVPATCPLVVGRTRSQMVAAVAREYETLVPFVSRPYEDVRMQFDVVLAAYSRILHFALILEDAQTFARFAASVGHFLYHMPEDLLPRKEELANFYFHMARPKGFPSAPVIEMSPRPGATYNAFQSYFSGTEYLGEPLPLA